MLQMHWNSLMKKKNPQHNIEGKSWVTWEGSPEAQARQLKWHLAPSFTADGNNQPERKRPNKAESWNENFENRDGMGEGTCRAQPSKALQYVPRFSGIICMPEVTLRPKWCISASNTCSVFAQIHVKPFFSLPPPRVNDFWKLQEAVAEVLLFASPGKGMWEGTACSSNPLGLHGTAGDWAATGSRGGIKLCKMLQSEEILHKKIPKHTVFWVGCNLLKSLLAFVNTLVVLVKDK